MKKLFLVVAALVFPVCAFAPDEALEAVLAQLGRFTPVALTFAGIKPLTNERSDMYGMGAEELVRALDAARARGRISNPNLGWFVQSMGDSKQIMFFHRGAIRQLAASPAGRARLAAAGVVTQNSEGPSVDEVLKKLKSFSERPETRRSPAESAALGLFFGIPDTQVSSYLATQAAGKRPFTTGKLFNWFEGESGTYHGFIYQPEDPNQDELKALSARSQAAWEIYFQEVELRKQSPLAAMTTLELHPLNTNFTRGFNCRKRFQELWEARQRLSP